MKTLGILKKWIVPEYKSGLKGVWKLSEILSSSIFLWKAIRLHAFYSVKLISLQMHGFILGRTEVSKNIRNLKKQTNSPVSSIFFL